MTDTVPLVPCRQCKGDGKHPMPPAYRATYALLPRAIADEAWAPTPDLLSAINVGRRPIDRVKQTALCNRLAWLRREGFAECRVNERNHRILEWRRTNGRP